MQDKVGHGMWREPSTFDETRSGYVVYDDGWFAEISYRESGLWFVTIHDFVAHEYVTLSVEERGASHYSKHLL